MQDVNSYSTARIYTKSLAKARLLAKDQKKSQIRIIEEAINLLWSDKMNQEEPIDIMEHLPEEKSTGRGIENAVQQQQKRLNQIKSYEA